MTLLSCKTHLKSERYWSLGFGYSWRFQKLSVCIHLLPLTMVWTSVAWLLNSSFWSCSQTGCEALSVLSKHAVGAQSLFKAVQLFTRGHLRTRWLSSYNLWGIHSMSLLLHLGAGQTWLSKGVTNLADSCSTPWSGPLQSASLKPHASANIKW